MSIYKQRLHDALEVPFIGDADAMERFKSIITDIETGDDKAREEALKKWGAAVHKYMTTAHRSARPEGITKNYESLSGGKRQTIDFYRSWTDELSMDMDWMPFFRQTSTAATGSSTVDIIDFQGTVTVTQHGDGESIKMSTYGSDSRTRLTYQRWATGLPFLRVWLENNDLYSINDAMEGIRVAFMAKKADEAYAALGVAGAATSAPSASTTAARIEALNTGATALLKRVSDSGFNLSAQTPLLIMSAIDHQDEILQMFEQTAAGDGAGPRPRFRIVPVFTFNSNFPTQITGGTNSYNLFLPQRKIIWNSFSANMTKQEVDFSTDSIKVMAHEYWNKNVPSAQVQTIDLD